MVSSQKVENDIGKKPSILQDKVSPELSEESSKSQLETYQATGKPIIDSQKIKNEIKKFDENRNFKDGKEPENIKLANEERKKFVNSFPRHRIRDIEIDDYVPGKTPLNDSSFAYLNEFGSLHFGSNKGGGASKFGVWIEKESQQYTWAGNESWREGKNVSGFETIEEAYSDTIKTIADCVDAAEDCTKSNDWERLNRIFNEKVELKKYTPWPLVVCKAIAMYFPHHFPFSWGHDHLNFVLNVFGINHEDIEEDGHDFYKKLSKLVAFKNAHPIMQNWTNRYLATFLKETFPDWKDASSFRDDSVLLKFLKEGKLGPFANYQPIVIKMLLESEDHSVTIKDIRKKFDELNFGRYSYTDTSGKPMGNSAIDSVRKSLEKFVTFPEGTTEGSAELIQETFNESEKDLCLKICGQRIVQLHYERYANDGIRMWGVWPGSPDDEPVPFHYLDEFLDKSLIGIGYDKNITDLSKFADKDEANEFLKKYESTRKRREMILNFSHDMDKKDFVVVTKGRGEIVDYGIITSDYEWKDTKSRDVPKHRRDVVYLKIGPIDKSAFPRSDLLNDFIGTVHEITGEEDV